MSLHVNCNFKISEDVLNVLRALSPAIYFLNSNSEKINIQKCFKAYCDAMNALSSLVRALKDPSPYLNEENEKHHFYCQTIFTLHRVSSSPTLSEQSLSTEEESSGSTENTVIESQEEGLEFGKCCSCLKTAHNLIYNELTSYLSQFNQFSQASDKDKSDIFDVIKLIKSHVNIAFKIKSNIENKKSYLENAYSFWPRFFELSPLIELIRKEGMNKERKNELLFRTDFLQNLYNLKESIYEKFPPLKALLNDRSNYLYKKFFEIENRIILFSGIIFTCNKENLTIKNYNFLLIEALNSLVNEKEMDFKTAEILLTLILKRCSFYPILDQIKDRRFLSIVIKKGMEQISGNKSTSSQYSRYKDIFNIYSKNSVIIGKYKPCQPSNAVREVRGYEYDCLLGMGMTPPTGFAHLSIKRSLLLLQSTLDLVQKKLKTSNKALISNELFLAKIAKEEAIHLQKQALKQLSKLPTEIQTELYLNLSSYVHGYEDLNNGTHDWFDLDFSRISNNIRINSINCYLKSNKFIEYKNKNPIESKDHGGSVQLWINDSKTFDDLFFLDPNAGEKIKKMPSALVHLHCILGIVKGTGDGHTGNSIATFSLDGSIQSIYEIDDERILLSNNEYTYLRMWQFGLPQADQPFNRTTLLLFSKDELLKKIRTFNASDKKQLIFKYSYEAQEKRIEKMISLFQMELVKLSPTLTPRQLFFELFGGSEIFNSCFQKNALNPCQIFESHLGCYNGVGKNYYKSEVAKINFNSIYDLKMEERCEQKLKSVQVSYPRARIIVEFDAGFGNNLYIKGSLPTLDWEQPVLLTNINGFTWIFESDLEFTEGEYTIYLLSENDKVAKVEKSLVNHKIDETFESRVVFPDF